jgi:hypothetical protein
MVCFSSKERIRLNSIINGSFFSLPSPDICCSGHSTLCGNGNAVVEREEEIHVLTGAEGGHLMVRLALICHPITGASARLINNSTEALELQSCALSLIIPSRCNTKEGQE